MAHSWPTRHRAMSACRIRPQRLTGACGAPTPTDLDHAATGWGGPHARALGEETPRTSGYNLSPSQNQTRSLIAIQSDKVTGKL